MVLDLEEKVAAAVKKLKERGTRGFYERAGALYHCVRGTPPKCLFWTPLRGGRWQINWPRTNRGG